MTCVGAKQLQRLPNFQMPSSHLSLPLKIFIPLFLQFFAHFRQLLSQKVWFVKLLVFNRLTMILLLIFWFGYCNFARQLFNNYSNGKIVLKRKCLRTERNTSCRKICDSSNILVAWICGMVTTFYSSFIAILAHASASARAWWWCSKW